MFWAGVGGGGENGWNLIWSDYGGGHKKPFKITFNNICPEESERKIRFQPFS